jgi:ADP-heptose:LPS heptosyltransferase
MNINFQRKVDRYLGTFICRLLSFFCRGQKQFSAPDKVDNILVILLSEMGSLVLSYPMFQELKAKYPAARLHGLLFEKNQEILELIDVMPAANILAINDKSLTAFVKDCINVLIRMRKTKFDIVIDCELFARISSIFSFFSGAGIRVGFHPHTQEGLYRGNFINRPVPYNPYHHISRQFLALVAAIDCDSTPMPKQSIDADNLRAPVISFKKEDIENMRCRIIQDFPAVGDKKLILIYPGGGLLSIRAWPLDYYCMLAAQFIERGYAVAVIGLVEDKMMAAEILLHCQNPACIDLTGYTKTVRELLLIFQFADLLITNDGGPGQFAAMTPIASIIFYGPETPELYGPADNKATIFYQPLACTPCLTAYNHRNSPCDGDNLCLKQIKPDGVLQRALDILEG